MPFRPPATDTHWVAGRGVAVDGSDVCGGRSSEMAGKGR
jgi:hypothetical protein